MLNAADAASAGLSQLALETLKKLGLGASWGICVQSNGGGDDCCRSIMVGMILSCCYLVWSYCPLIIGVAMNIAIVMLPITHTPFFDG